MKRDIIIVGTGGLAREFSDFFSEQINILGYSSKNDKEFYSYGLSGDLYTEDDISPNIVGTDMAVIAIGDPRTKYMIWKSLRQKGFIFPYFIHKSCNISSSLKISEGVIISPNSIISTNVNIGKLTYINTTCAIGHDVKIGGFCQLNGGQIGGNTKIGDFCLIGSGSTIIEKRIIGNNVLVCSGSVVMTNFDDNVTIMGNIAKVSGFRKKIDE